MGERRGTAHACRAACVDASHSGRAPAADSGRTQPADARRTRTGRRTGRRFEGRFDGRSNAAPRDAAAVSSARCPSCSRSPLSPCSRRRRSPGCSRRTGAATQGVIAAPRDVGTVPTQAGAHRPVRLAGAHRHPGHRRERADREGRHAAGTAAPDPARPQGRGLVEVRREARRPKGTAIIAGHINYAGVTGEFADDRHAGSRRPGVRLGQARPVTRRGSSSGHGRAHVQEDRAALRGASSTSSPWAGSRSSRVAGRSTRRPATTSTTSSRSPSPCGIPSGPSSAEPTRAAGHPRVSSNTGSSDSYTAPSAPKIRKRSSERANQRSCVTARTVPSNDLERLLERLGARSRRGCRSARRAAAASRRTVRAAGSGTAPAARPTACRTAGRAWLAQPVAAQRGHRPSAVDAAAGRSSPSHSRSTQRAVEPARMGMRLREQAGHDARAEPPIPRVRNGFAAEQPQEVRLARAVRAEHADPLAVEDLGVERTHQPGQLEALAGDRAHAGPPAAKPHRDVLLLGGLSGGGPAASNRSSRRAMTRYFCAMTSLIRACMLQGADEILEPGVLLVPPAPQLGHPFVPVPSAPRDRTRTRRRASRPCRPRP